MLFWLRRPLGEIPPSPPLAKGGGGGICLAKGVEGGILSGRRSMERGEDR